MLLISVNSEKILMKMTEQTKEKKNHAINIMVSATTKKKLQLKAKALNLSLTSYIEKVSSEDIIFMDSNLKLLLKNITFE